MGNEADGNKGGVRLWITNKVKSNRFSNLEMARTINELSNSDLLWKSMIGNAAKVYIEYSLVAIVALIPVSIVAFLRPELKFVFEISPHSVVTVVATFATPMTAGGWCFITPSDEEED